MAKEKYLISYVILMQETISRYYINDVIDYRPAEWVKEVNSLPEPVAPRDYILLSAIPISDEEYQDLKRIFDPK